MSSHFGVLREGNINNLAYVTFRLRHSFCGKTLKAKHLANRRIRPLCHLSGAAESQFTTFAVRALTASVTCIYVTLEAARCHPGAGNGARHRLRLVRDLLPADMIYRHYPL